jgi:hypothetical protein
MKTRREYLCLSCEWIGDSDVEVKACPRCGADENNLCYVNVNDNEMAGEPPHSA